MNEEQLRDMMQNIDKIPSDVIAQARKFANTRAGREMIKEMGQQIDMENFKIPNQNTLNVLVIRPNGIVKTRSIVISEDCPSILHATTPTKIIFNDYIVWYDASIKSINKKASKWLNQNVGGMVIVIGDINHLKF